MKLILVMILAIPLSSHAAFIFNYGLNYSTGKETSSDGGYDSQMTFHKIFLGASINNDKTFFFGWNTNSWTSSIKQGSTNRPGTYSMLEMGPRLYWYLNDTQNFYITAGWNPYARGKRQKASVSKDVQGSSFDVGLGYRFKLSRLWGLGAGIHYHSLSLNEEKLAQTETSISDTVGHMMPMLELTIITK